MTMFSVEDRSFLMHLHELDRSEQRNVRSAADTDGDRVTRQSPFLSLDALHAQLQTVQANC